MLGDSADSEMVMENRPMPGWLGTAALVLAGLSLVLVVANAALLVTNQNVQGDVNARAQYINQTNQLGQLNTTLVRALANAAVNAKDDKLTDLLTQQGITYRVTPNAAPAGTAGAGAAAPKTPGKP